MKKLNTTTGTATAKDVKKALSPRKAKGAKPAATVTPINELTLSSAKEAEIATEYGDGTEFKEGDTVLHNHEAGTYAQVHGEESEAVRTEDATIAQELTEKVEEVKESAVDRWLDKKAAEKEAKENPPAAPPAEAKKEDVKPAAKPAAAAKPKTSRFASTAITLVNPEAASPSWKGKRGKAFGIIENHYVTESKMVDSVDGYVVKELTVSDWLLAVTADPELTKVGFEFLRFYEGQNLIKLTVVEPAKPAAADTKAEA